MDSLTQIVLGAAMGEAAIGKKVGNKAMLWGAIAGTIPDLDVLTKLFTDDVTANEMHRGFSHSILFSIIAAPLLGWILAQLYRNKEANWKDWTWLMFLGIFTHPILDAFTTWGTQLFWPYTYKVSFKNIFVVDPLYTIPFLIFLIMAMCYHRTHPKRRKWNRLGIIISSLYMLLTLGFKWISYHQFKSSLIAQQISYISIQNRPTPLNSILWTASIETSDSFLIGYYSLLDGKHTIPYTRFPKNHHLLSDLAADPLIPRLITLTEGWYSVEKINDTLYVNDLRFGQMGIGTANATFVFSYELYRDTNGILKAKERERKMDEVMPLFKELFTRVLGI